MRDLSSSSFERIPDDDDPPGPTHVASPDTLLGTLYAVAMIASELPPRRPGATSGVGLLIEHIGERLVERALVDHGFAPGSRVWEDVLPLVELATATVLADVARWN